MNPKRISKYHYEKYDNTEYLTRDLTYTDKFGQYHSYCIADEQLSRALFDDFEKGIDNSDIDNQFYCYAPISALLIESDQELAVWLDKNVTEMDL